MTEKLTVFTPAYNRAHTLPRAFEALKKQSDKRFVWLIVDDGSTDNTREVVEDFQKEDCGFKIEYVYKENGGMHTAHNTAYKNIDTELNVCIDSDDELADGAVRCILDLWKKIDHKKYAGIIGLDAYLNTGKVIGTDFPDNMKETTLAGFYDAGGSGDKKLVYRTDIMKALPPYPVFEGEKYVSLGWKYQLCDQRYRLVTTNTVLCNVEYQADGSSNNMLRQYLRNPKGFAFIRKENMKYITDFKRNVIDAIHYCSSSRLSHNKNYIKESPKPLLTLLCTPAGWLLTAYIKRKVTR